MNFSRALMGAATAVCLVAASPLSASASAGASGGPVVTRAAVKPAAVAAPAASVDTVTADYEMNEAPGSSVMTDSSGNGLNGVINPTGVQTGATFDGATGYNWVRRPPTTPPPSPERVIQVPDSINLEPGNVAFTLEIRYRTPEKFGNIIQKGQATTPGGQWKIQNPGGIPSCLFKGSKGRVATGALTPLNDNQWHTLDCVLTSTSVSIYVDGVFRNKKNGSPGTIDNTFPMTVGGKLDCDQIAVTCDYYSGQIDYVKITKSLPVNQPPVASFTTSCAALLCSFDSSSSSDPDGTIASYAWDFGDGSTSTLAGPHHLYAAAGPYDVTLTVQDNSGASTSITKTINVSDQSSGSSVAFVGSAISASNSKSPTVTVPAAAVAGQRLVLVLTDNDQTKTVSDPTGVTGWTRLGSVAAKTMGTTVWTKVAAAGDPGTVLHVPVSAAVKHTLTVAAYDGVDNSVAGLTFAQSTDLASGHTARATPNVATPDGAWVVSYWADKSTNTTAWTPEGSVTTRKAACSADAGHICSAFADSGQPVPAGTYGNIMASTDAPSDAAAMWSIVLASAP